MKRYSILQRYKSRGNMTWYGRISDGGIIRYVSLKVTRKSDAQEWLNRQNSRKFLPEELLAEKKDRRLQVAANAYLDNVSSAHGPESLTYKAYGNKLKYLMRWAERHDVMTLRDFNRERASRSLPTSARSSHRRRPAKSSASRSSSASGPVRRSRLTTGRRWPS